MGRVDRERAVRSTAIASSSRMRAALVLTGLVVFAGCASGSPLVASGSGGDGGAGATADGGSPVGSSQATDPFARWRAERALRQRDLDAYLAANESGLRALLYAPLGTFGIPRTTFDAFTTVMPDRWGPPEEKLAAVGLGPDLHDPSNPLPLGIATFEAGGSELVIFSCAACHVGRVIGPDGNEQLLFGAPNTRFDAVFTAFEDAAADPRYAQLGGGLVAQTVKEALLLRRQVEERTIGGLTYDRGTTPNAPDPFATDRRGFFDSYAVIFAMRTLPESLLPGTNATLAAIMPPCRARPTS